MTRWVNWGGNVACEARAVEQPCDEAALVPVLERARREGLTVRAAGAGHSFSQLIATDGLVVSLDALAGIVRHDAAARRATARAGTRLHDLGKPLRELGLAQQNLGDIDVQALGGALATGTHGTGRTLGNLSSHVCGMRLVLASGEAVELEGERLRAARVSLGALGIATEVTLDLVPAHRLRELTWRSPLPAVLEALETHVATHRHFEFFYFPKHDFAECKAIDPVETAQAAGIAGTTERIDWSDEILPSVREERFAEMEYSVPEEVGPACFAAVRERVRRNHPEVVWPLEYRTVAADDALLSPAHGRATAAISVHQDGRFPYEPVFRDVEPIFAEHGGRPHWGKVHFREAAGLAPVYPQWEAFARVRAELDPAGRFLNEHLHRLLGA